jgi:hypothetical protein
MADAAAERTPKRSRERRRRRPRSQPRAHPERPLQIVLLAGAIGAFAILLSDVVGTIVSLIGLAAVVVATVLSAPAAAGAGWWKLLAVGAGLSVLAALLALVANTLGGLVAVVGGVLVVIGAALGFPLGEEGLEKSRAGG